MNKIKSHNHIKNGLADRKRVSQLQQVSSLFTLAKKMLSKYSPRTRVWRSLFCYWENRHRIYTVNLETRIL